MGDLTVSMYTGQGGTSFTSVPLQLRQSTGNYHIRCHEPLPDQAQILRNTDPSDTASDGFRLYLAPASAPPTMFPRHNGARGFALGPVDSPYFKPLSRQEKEYMLTHTTNGERRRFRRGQPEPPLKKINICSELCHR